ncbi:2Fe-2S iron-sulfur cluster-binding protein [Leptolyngbyaceae cyanobacterium UHCC 1019]
MPTIKTQGKTFECESGANLRQIMLKNGAIVYNGAANTVNCHGLGTCGTCAVEIEGAVSEMGWREKARLSLPPHSLEKNRRLSCQVAVLGDLTVLKHQGFWGQEDEILQ